MDQHEHGKMDITAQQQTFAGFIRALVVSAIVVAVVLIFLALVNA